MYKWDPEEYNKSSSKQQKWAHELILKLDFKGDERVLDIGCGDGKVTAEIARRLWGIKAAFCLYILKSSNSALRASRHHRALTEALK